MPKQIVLIKILLFPNLKRPDWFLKPVRSQCL